MPEPENPQNYGQPGAARHTDALHAPDSSKSIVFFLLCALTAFLLFSGLLTWLFPTWTPGYNATLLNHMFLGEAWAGLFVFYLALHLMQIASPAERRLVYWTLFDFCLMVAGLFFLEDLGKFFFVPVVLLAHAGYCVLRFSMGQFKKRRRNMPSLLLGYLDVFAFFFATLFGAINWFGNIRDPGLTLRHHRIWSFVFLAVVGLHLALSMKDASSAGRLLPAWKKAMAQRSVLAAVAGLFLLGASISYPQYFIDSTEAAANYGKSGYAAPENFEIANMKIDSDEYPTPNLMANSRSCGDQAGCHSDIYIEWESSGHRLAGNRAVRYVIQNAVNEEGRAMGEYCIACHMPASLSTGQVWWDDIANQSDKTATDGISCMVCHSVSEVEPEGNGSFAISPLFKWIQTGSDADSLKKRLNVSLIKFKPDFHNRLFRKGDPMFKSGEYCGTCHQTYLDGPDGRLQFRDLYDTWAEWKQITGRNDTCNDCHMPHYEDHVGNPIRSHRFYGGNQALEILTDDWSDIINPIEIFTLIGARSNYRYPEKGVAAQERANEAYLKGEIEARVVNSKKKGAASRVAMEKGPLLDVKLELPEAAAPGERVEVKAVTRNLKSGHNFPGGTVHWLALEANDANGDVIYRSGFLDENNYLDPDAHVLGNRYLTDEGAPPQPCSIWQVGKIAGSRYIPPAGSIEDVFEFEIPPSAKGPISIKAAWRYREIDQKLIDQAYGEESGVTLPVTELASVTQSMDLR